MSNWLVLCTVPSFAEEVLRPSKMSSERTSYQEILASQTNTRQIFFIVQFAAGVPNLLLWSGNLGLVLGIVLSPSRPKRGIVVHPAHVHNVDWAIKVIYGVIGIKNVSCEKKDLVFQTASFWTKKGWLKNKIFPLLVVCLFHWIA